MCLDDKEILLRRINDLESKVNQLQTSRRVLLHLVEKIENEKCLLVQQLQKEKRSLKLKNVKYARLLFENKDLILFSGKD